MRWDSGSGCLALAPQLLQSVVVCFGSINTRWRPCLSACSINARLVAAIAARRVQQPGRRAARVQRPDRPRAPTHALPTQRRPIGSGQPAQRRIVSPATPAIPNTHPKIPPGQTLLVTVLLRRLVRRRTTVDYQAIHRTTEPARLGRPTPRADKQNRLPPGRKTARLPSRDMT